VWVGGSTVAAILAQRLVPWLADLYLGRTGYGAQQDDEAADPDRRDNLFEPIPGHHGSHGRFDARASATSLQLELSKRAGWVATAAAAALVLAARRR
jgi:hypothetical protein